MYLVLNSNPWFSAVSDYSLQMSLCLKQENKNLLYCAHQGHTQMDKKCKEAQIPFKHIPIHHQNMFDFLKSFCVITFLLIKHRHALECVVAFEGREHTILALTKLFFPFLWKRKKLIRVRGQAQIVKSNPLVKFIYKCLTDQLICAAQCVQKRILFQTPPPCTKIQLYGKHFQSSGSIDLSFAQLDRQTEICFLLLGRFDPVKGHDNAIKAYLAAQFPVKTKLIFLGRSENILTKDMQEKYLPLFSDGNKSLEIKDNLVENTAQWLQSIHFGLIPSLDSEVICRVGVEFLQSGVPVLYSNAGALPEVFSDFPQWGFQKDDIIDFTQKWEKACQLALQRHAFYELRKKCHAVGMEKYNGCVYLKLF